MFNRRALAAAFLFLLLKFCTLAQTPDSLKGPDSVRVFVPPVAPDKPQQPPLDSLEEGSDSVRIFIPPVTPSKPLPPSTDLPRSMPETEGVSSEAILRFLEAVEKSPWELHSFMLLRHGKVVAEVWNRPYRRELKHTLYSCSKSFTATAIGFLVSEKRLTVDDKVVSFFPDDLPAKVSPNLAAMRVRDLLSMSVGHEPDPTFAVLPRDSNWVRSFLATPVVHEPGTKFMYHTLATYMLSAIVQKVAGEKLLDYLRPRLFQPLDITDVDWETDPRGISVGGWGLRLRTEDMAKFAQLFLQKGQWKGKQILPAEWVEEATTMKIMQHPDWPQAKQDSSDWAQGYCYQMWRSRHNSFRGDGAYGQLMMVLPEKDAVVVVTAESHDMQGEMNCIWQHLLPAFGETTLPANPRGMAMLRQKTLVMSLPLPAKSVKTPTAKAISGKKFALAENELRVQSLDFQFKNEICRMVLEQGADTFHLSFSPGFWKFGETKKYPPALMRPVKNYFAGLPPSKIAGAYRWADANTLELTLRYLESPHHEVWTCRFEKNGVSVEYVGSNKPNQKVSFLGSMFN